jgi:archaemetzincin
MLIIIKNIVKIFAVFLIAFVGLLGNAQTKPNEVIFIQPLGDVNPQYVDKVKSAVESFFGFRCVVRSSVEFTIDILAASKTRYEAGKIIDKYSSNDYLLISTEKDIACVNGDYPEWGIFGLGEMPGTTCVVSTFRLKRKVSESIFIDHLIKVSLHEIGHNLGLNHCNNDPRCMMNDAKGSAKGLYFEKIWFCDKCRKLIDMK